MLKDSSVEEGDCKSAEELSEELPVSSRECAEKTGIVLSEVIGEEVVPSDPDCSWWPRMIGFVTVFGCSSRLSITSM